MKSSIMSSIAVVTFITFIVLILVAVIVFPMRIGEPSYYHVARVDCLLAAIACALVAIVSAIVSANS